MFLNMSNYNNSSFRIQTTPAQAVHRSSLQDTLPVVPLTTLKYSYLLFLFVPKGFHFMNLIGPSFWWRSNSCETKTDLSLLAAVYCLFCSNIYPFSLFYVIYTRVIHHSTLFLACAQFLQLWGWRWRRRWIDLPSVVPFTFFRHYVCLAQYSSYRIISPGSN